MTAKKLLPTISPPAWIRSVTILTYSFILSALMSALVHIIVPRLIGPSAFGKIHLFESLSATLFLFSSLGIDQYIRRELPQSSCSSKYEFIYRILRIRQAIFAAIIAVSAPLIYSLNDDISDVSVGVLFLFIQSIIITNSTYSAMLHAKGRFKDASKIAITSKVIWSILTLSSAYIFKSPILIATAFLLSEAARLAQLKHTAGQVFNTANQNNDNSNIISTLIPLLPFILSTSFQQIYARVDVQMISMFNQTQEVGWYGAACTITSLGLIALPSLVAVLTPEYANSTNSSENNKKLFQSIYASSIIFTAASVVLIALSKPIIQIVYGHEFTYATDSLMVLSAMIPSTYVASICGIYLTSTGRIWHLTWVTAIGLAVNVSLNSILIPHFSKIYPLGGGSLGASIASLSNEILMMFILILICIKKR